MDKPLLRLRNKLVQEKFIKRSDEIAVKRGLNTESFVFINGNARGKCSYNAYKNKFEDYIHFKPKKTSKFKENRKKLWKKKEYNLGDFIKSGKIKLQT